MSEENSPVFTNVTGFSIQQSLRGYDFDVDTLRRLYRNLSRVLAEHADSIVKGLSKPDDETQEEWEVRKQRFRREAFRVTVSVISDDGANHFGDDISIFDALNMPRVVKTVFYTNNTAYKALVGTDVPDKFDILIDFSKPPLLDWSNLLSAPTPNNSNVSVSSFNSMFKNTILSEVISSLSAKRKLSSAFHQAFIYDAFLYFAAVPYAFYLTSKLSNSAWIKTYPIEWRVPLYVYAFLLIASGYRFLFSYFKWAFPINTLKGNDDASSKHRGFFTFIVAALLGAAVYDAAKWIIAI
ncbi:hypothetical protein [Microvirga solisilvae]|uniref:hypothetical protein n=1 Tax=Microvirga solisilvae TaxID=2919498 RepID=UPI001FAF5FDB|nr:hypothetical protein [Microvirga solisilvae]